MFKSRKNISVKVSEVNGVKTVHFIGIYKLSGGKGTLNFPLFDGIALFLQIEAIMLANKMCNNVTRVTPVSNETGETMYEVAYNLPVNYK